MSQITGTVNHTVEIAPGHPRGGYGSPLTVTSTGAVLAATGTVGVDGLAGASGLGLTNHGVIAGGTGAEYGSGGGGVELSQASVYNNGYIYGGHAGSTYSDGGTGVDLTNCTLVNTLAIYGGDDAARYGANLLGAHAGVGAYLSGGTATNYGFIDGGDSTAWDGGNAVDLTNNANFVDDGTPGHAAIITGGSGEEYGGIGVSMSSGATLNCGKYGTITGGTGFGGGDGVAASGTSTRVDNYGSIIGGHGYQSGVGVSLSSEASLYNAGIVQGGTGQLLGDGIGVYGNAATVYNAGSILGGVNLVQSANLINYDGAVIQGEGVGAGAGAEVADGSSLTNDYGGLIGATYAKAGVYVARGALNNHGTIQGGVGATATGTPFGGTGGLGVSLNAGTVTNTGDITGGDGGASYSNGGRGGAGVLLNGGTLTTSGTISGGVGGKGAIEGASGVAVQFGSTASTMVVESGAVFNGAIGGFGTSDTIDIANLTPSEVAADFNPTTHVLTTAGDGILHFTGGFSGEYFAFSSDGSSGSDVTLERGSGISTTLTSTVTLGSAAHKSPLTITTTGVVAPTNVGANAVLSNMAGNVLTNNGTIQGATGLNFGVGGAGGAGANFKMAGTLTNTGSITGGAGGPGATIGGHGGAGVAFNGGTLENAGTISGGPGGSGQVSGTAGNAVTFGAATSTLVVDPGAVFLGKVVANASAHDVLEISGTQAGGTPITLGTQFTNFATLDFAAGATGTVDATKAALLAPHTLTIDGFGLGDTLDITNLKHSGTTASFDATKEILTITQGATVIELGFNSAFTGEHFVLASDGHGGTDVTLQTGAASEPMALHGFSSHAFADHGLAHDASVMMS